MRLPQLALTLVLVAGGIFLYDVLLVRRPVEPAPEPLREEPDRAPPRAAEPPPFALLEGRGDEVWRSDVERRLERLERRSDPPGGAAATDPPPSDSPGVPPEGSRAAEASAPDGETQAAPGPFPPRDVATFRALLETVERERREETTRRQVLDGLKRIGVELEETQANQVVDLTLKLYRDFQTRTRDVPNDEQNRGQRLAVFSELRREYEDGLYRVIPRDDADRIVRTIDARLQQQSGGTR